MTAGPFSLRVKGCSSSFNHNEWIRRAIALQSYVGGWRHAVSIGTLHAMQHVAEPRRVTVAIPATLVERLDRARARGTVAGVAPSVAGIVIALVRDGLERIESGRQERLTAAERERTP